MWLGICAENPGMWLRHPAYVCVRKCVVDSGMVLHWDTGFGFGYTVWLWVFGLYVRESIGDAGIRDSLGIVQLSGKLGKKRKYCKRPRSPEVGRVCFPFS